jgi:hypothetical protein
MHQCCGQPDPGAAGNAGAGGWCGAPTVWRWERRETSPQPWCRPKLADLLRNLYRQMKPHAKVPTVGDFLEQARELVAV